MNFIQHYLEFVLHLDVHLQHLLMTYGAWVYGLLFLIIFFESGIFLTPFLPGESLLFAAGSLAAAGYLNVNSLAFILTVAAVLGGFVNYALGWLLGKRLVSLKKESQLNTYLQKTHDFYEKHGPLAVMIARLIPIIRTYAPFVAGIARMNFFFFAIYNVIGGVLWISIFIYTSYHFGNLPVIKQHFSMIIIAIIFISVIPVMIEFFRHRFGVKNNAN